MKSQQSGFTLIELLVVTALMSVLAVISAAVLVPQYRSGINDKTIGEIYTIQEAAQNYFIDNDELPGGSSCATAINKLRADDYLLAIDKNSPWGTAYTTECTSILFKVSVDIPAPYGGRALNTLIDASLVGNTVTSSVPTPNMIPTSGDYLSRTSGNPQERTMEADILMDGHGIQNAGVIEADTGNFSGEVQASTILLTGGDLNVDGGSVIGVGDIEMINGVRIVSEGGRGLRIEADSTLIDGDLDVAGTVFADEVMTREGVRLSESLQDTDILKMRPSGPFAKRIKAPNCAPGTTPSVFSTPVRIGGGISTSETAPMGSITTRMYRTGNYYYLDMTVTDTNERTSHTPPDGLDYALVFTRCVR